MVVFTQGKDDTVATVGRPFYCLLFAFALISVLPQNQKLAAALQEFPTLAPLGCLRPHIFLRGQDSAFK